jgi:hypothetical protein
MIRTVVKKRGADAGILSQGVLKRYFLVEVVVGKRPAMTQEHGGKRIERS